MPRRPRLDLPDIPQHIVQRGNDRQPCFFGREDYVRYLKYLREITLRHECRVHAYVLMTNHVHLLMTPRHKGSMAQVMQTLGRRYVQDVNARYHRSGTLWEGRYKSCPVDSETYLLCCYRYIELNPVRACMVDAPSSYQWSSFAHNALGRDNPLITPHSVYAMLGDSPAARQRAYLELVTEGTNVADTNTIRLHLQRGYALGPESFRKAIEAQLNRRAGPGRNGRPPNGEQRGETAL